MKKNEIIPLLVEGFTFEEVSHLMKLNEIEELIERVNLEDSIKIKLKEMLNELKIDTIRHSKEFSNMIKEIKDSKKDEY